MRNRTTILKYLPFLVLLCATSISLLLHWEIFTKDITGLHTWRQCQTQWNIRNFHRHDANIFNPRVAHFNSGNNLYRYEFPIMQWSIAMVQKIFGDSILVVRICIFIIGLLTLFIFYHLLFALFKNTWTAILGTIALQFSPLFYYYTVNPMPDNLALCFGVSFLYFFIKNHQKKEDKKSEVLAAFFLLMATLTKLPFILLGGVAFAKILLDWKKLHYRFESSIIRSVFLYSLFIIPAILWYTWVIPTWEGNGVTSGIFENVINFTGLLGILKYYVTTLFPNILMTPISTIYLLAAIYFSFKRKLFQKELGRYFLCSIFLLSFFILFEANMIDKSHDYYFMPFLPFLYILIALGIDTFWRSIHWLKYLVLGSIALIIFQSHQQNKDNWQPEKSGLNIDFFTHQESLKNAMPNNERCIIINDHSLFSLSYLIDKQGFVFFGDHLKAPWIIDMRDNDQVTHLYSTSRLIEADTNINMLFERKVLDAGSVHVFKLKTKK